MREGVGGEMLEVGEGVVPTRSSGRYKSGVVLHLLRSARCAGSSRWATPQSLELTSGREMDAGDEAKRAVAAAFRECRKNALAKQAAGARSRFALRLMVEERLSHPLLEQMHTEDFAKNPLADDDMTDSAVELGQRLQVLQRELAAAAAAYDEVEDETPEWAAEEEAKEVDEEDEDDDAMADYEARFMAGGVASAPAATGALPPSSTAARDDGNGIEENALLDVSSSGLDDLLPEIL